MQNGTEKRDKSNGRRLVNMKTATQKVKEDLAAAGKSGNQVELARKKCDALRNSISNLNRTISVLKNQRKTEEHQFTVHHAVMKDNVDLAKQWKNIYWKVLLK